MPVEVSDRTGRGDGRLGDPSASSGAAAGDAAAGRLQSGAAGDTVDGDATLDRATLGRAGEHLLALLDRSDHELGVVLVGDDQMRELNRRYRRVDRTTDVLSFSQLDPEAAEQAASGSPNGVDGATQDRAAPGADAVTAGCATYGGDSRAEPCAANAAPADEPLLGDVVICVDAARRQASQGGWTLEEELNRLLLHGVLHLLGHDHEQGGEPAARMHGEERRLSEALVAAGFPCAREEPA